MRSRLSRSEKDDNDFEDRLSAVEAKLDKIINLLEPKKPSVKKASKKRTTTMRTKKTAAKKAFTKKTTSKK